MYKISFSLVKNINVGFLILFIGTLIGRSLGYIRELVIAYLYGVSEKSDQVLLLLTIPDIVNNIISSTAVGTVIIPFLFKSQGSSKVYSIIKKYLIELGVGVTVITALLIFIFYDFSIWIPALLALLSVYANWNFALSISVAQYFQNFFLSSISNIIYNVGVIVAVFASFFGNFFLGLILFITTYLRNIFSNLYNKKKGFQLNRLSNDNVNVSRQEIIVGLFSSGLFYVIPSLDRIIASNLSVGSLSYFNYAEKIFYLPLSLLIAPLLQSVYPRFSKMIADKEFLEFKSYFSSIAVKIFLASLLTTIVFFIFSDWIIKIFYSISSISSESKSIISQTLKLFSISLFPSAMLLLFLNLYFSLYQFKRIFIYCLIFLVFKVIILFIVSLFPALNYLLYGMILWVFLFSVVLFIDLQILVKKYE